MIAAVRSPGDVLQADIVRELGITMSAAAITQMRKRHLASSDWYLDKVGDHRMIRLTAEGEAKFRIWAECRKTEPQLVPNFIEVTVIGLLPNPNWISILVDHGEKGQLKENCAIPRRLHGRLTRGKRIRVEVVRDVTGVSYRHESLGTGY